MPVHSALTGSDLHEPKGVASATVDKVYVSNGSGSGNWQKIEADQIDTTSIFNANKGNLVIKWDDVTVADAQYLVFPFPCTIDTITTVLYNGAIATADEVITVTKTGGASLGTITITQSGSAEGDVDTLTPSSNNTLTANQYLKFSNNGASTGGRGLSLTVEYTRTGA